MNGASSSVASKGSPITSLLRAGGVTGEVRDMRAAHIAVTHPCWALGSRLGVVRRHTIDAREQLRQDRAALLLRLRQMEPDEWERPTAAAPWVVRDLVAHVLGDDLSRLARTRDSHSPVAPERNEPLASFIHRFDDEWVRATHRVSPRLLIDLLGVTSPQVVRLWQEIDQDGTADPVTWVAADPAPVWFSW